MILVILKRRSAALEGSTPKRCDWGAWQLLSTTVPRYSLASSRRPQCTFGTRLFRAV